MDFLADEMHGLRVWRDGDAHAFRGRCLFILRRAAAAILVIPAALEGTAFSAIARSTASAWSTVAVIAAWRAVVTTGKCFGFTLLGFVVGGACPRRSEGKAGQEAAQWVGIRIAHSANSKYRFRK